MLPAPTIIFRKGKIESILVFLPDVQSGMELVSEAFGSEHVPTGIRKWEIETYVDRYYHWFIWDTPEFTGYVKRPSPLYPNDHWSLRLQFNQLDDQTDQIRLIKTLMRLPMMQHMHHRVEVSLGDFVDLLGKAIR